MLSYPDVMAWTIKLLTRFQWYIKSKILNRWINIIAQKLNDSRYIFENWCCCWLCYGVHIFSMTRCCTLAYAWCWSCKVMCAKCWYPLEGQNMESLILMLTAPLTHNSLRVLGISWYKFTLRVNDARWNPRSTASLMTGCHIPSSFATACIETIILPYALAPESIGWPVSP